MSTPIGSSPGTGALFNSDDLTDDEVVRQLGTSLAAEALPSPATSVAHPSKASGPRRSTGAEPHIFTSAPKDQPDLFNVLSNYEQLPAEWQGKHLWQWNEDTRIIPVDVAISALFTIGNNKVPRAAFQREPIPILSKEFEMRYTGIELRQDDELNWMQLLHLNRGFGQPLGAPILFKAAAFLRELDLTPGAANYLHLKESLARLQATAIELYSKRLNITKTFRLVCHFEFEDENHYPLPAWKVVLDPRLYYLLEDRYHTRMSFERRKRLGNGLASKLHSYYACHKQPMDRSLDDLFRLCIGEEEAVIKKFLRSRRMKDSPESRKQAQTYLVQRRRDFKRDLEQALERLQSPHIGFLTKFEMFKEGKTVMVHVERNHDETPMMATMPDMAQ